jgi:hypothetical protein
LAASPIGHEKIIAYFSRIARLVYSNSAATGVRSFSTALSPNVRYSREYWQDAKRQDCWARPLDGNAEPTRSVERIRLIWTPRRIGPIHEPAK